MHLNADELVDLAEGTRPESASPHLASCAACRKQLADARAMMSAVADVEAPEPSPLFWDHLSSRVREAVAADPAPRRWWAAEWRLFAPVTAVAMAVLVAVLVNGRGTTPAKSEAPAFIASPAVADATTPRELLADSPGSTEDPALTLVAALTGDLNWDTAGEAGLAANGSAEHAVTHLDDKELRELRRLLAEEIDAQGQVM